MIRRALGGILLGFALGIPGSALGQDTLRVYSSQGGSGLEAAVAAAADGAGTVILLAPGIYDLNPEDITDPTCGNCEDPDTPVPASAGMVVTGDGIRIVGTSGDQRSVIRTHAGYGILFDDCYDCSLEEVVVTAGVRDSAAAATDGAVVARSSRVLIRDCLISHNTGDSVTVTETVVGIAGIVGREGAEMKILGNHILGNSWDGIVLYQDALGVIENNLVDGLDLARGDRIGGGRGVGIGVTGRATASIQGNLVRRYWKGIGVFLDASAIVRSNIVEHCAAWGMTLWDADLGSPSGRFEGNVIYDTGACGFALICRNAQATSRFVNNVLARTGQDPRYDSGMPYCIQVPIARHEAPDSFVIDANVFLENRVPEGLSAPADVGRAAFIDSFAPAWKGLRNWRAVQYADFWKMLGG